MMLEESRKKVSYCNVEQPRTSRPQDRACADAGSARVALHHQLQRIALGARGLHPCRGSQALPAPCAAAAAATRMDDYWPALGGMIGCTPPQSAPRNFISVSMCRWWVSPLAFFVVMSFCRNQVARGRRLPLPSWYRVKLQLTV